MLRTVALTGAVLGGCFLAFMHLVHEPAVLQVMGWSRPAGAPGGDACPFGYGAERVAQRAAVPRAIDYTREVASSRPALGFRLDATTRAEVAAWAVMHDVTCATTRDRTTLECANVPDSAVSDDAGSLALATTWFEFSPAGTLSAIKTVRRTEAARTVEAAFVATRDQLIARAGAPTAVAGEPGSLARGALRQASAEFLYRDYRAVVRATNIGDGYMLTESYASRLQ